MDKKENESDSSSGGKTARGLRSLPMVPYLWLPPIIWAMVIFHFSSYPTISTSSTYWHDFVIKKTVHVVEYAILATFLYRALKNSGMDRKRAGYWSIFLASFYGATDEFHQSFTPSRMPKMRDVFFDTIGSALAIYLIWKLLPSKRKSNKLLSLLYTFIYGKEKKGKENKKV